MLTYWVSPSLWPVSGLNIYLTVQGFAQYIFQSSTDTTKRSKDGVTRESLCMRHTFTASFLPAALLEVLNQDTFIKIGLPLQFLI